MMRGNVSEQDVHENGPRIADKAESSAPKAEDETGLEELLAFLDTTRAFDLRGYKRTSVARRIRRRMDVVGSTTCRVHGLPPGPP